MIRDFWDNQFKFSKIIPEFDELLGAMASDSREFASRHTLIRKNYGNSNRQWFETVEGSGSREILPVFVHGGFWRAMCAEDHRIVLEPLLPIARTVANIEYRLVNEARLPEIVSDVRTALESLAEQHPTLSLLPIGHSAGAHLIVSALSESSVSKNCTGVISLSGFFDLRPIPESFLQEELRFTDSEIKKYSSFSNPLENPVLFITGEEETCELKRQSAVLSMSGKAEWCEYEGANHINLPRIALKDIENMIARLQNLQNST